MSYIAEEIKFEDMDIILEVLEKTEGETFERGRIIDLETDSFQSYTPKELVRLGEWLIKHGTRIGKEYTTSGKRKVAKDK